jgi:hypothetical protein
MLDRSHKKCKGKKLEKVELPKIRMRGPKSWKKLEKVWYRFTATSPKGLQAEIQWSDSRGYY